MIRLDGVDAKKDHVKQCEARQVQRDDPDCLGFRLGALQRLPNCVSKQAFYSFLFLQSVRGVCCSRV